MRCAGFIFALLVNASLLGAGVHQAPRATALASFEVVSIKRNESGGDVGGIRPQPGGRVLMVNAPIARLIRAAYPNVTAQVGAPSWVDSERYDVDARAEGNPTANVIEAMLRAMLADRLQLAARIEPREQEVYALVVARSDGRPGPGLRPATLDCAEFVEKRPASGLNVPPRANGAPPCGLASDGRRLSAGGVTIAQLIRNLTPLAGRAIVDRTGFGGYYEFTLDYSARPGNAAGVPDSADDRPSIFTALQEQLGLALRPQRALVDVLIIDRIERPTRD